MKKVLFLIRSLNIGGAERQLLTLIRDIDKKKIKPVVVTFYEGGELLQDFIDENIPVTSANKKSRRDVIPFLFRLVRLIRAEKPDVIFSYLVAANLLAITLSPLFRPAKIAVSIRHSFVREKDYDRLSSFLYALENRLAGLSDLIVINSYIGADLAQKRGIPPGKIVVIPNGIDTEKFHPEYSGEDPFRRNYKIPIDRKVIGIIGRIDPIKDHKTFLTASKIVASKNSQCVFLIVGCGNKLLEQDLRVFANVPELSGKVFFIPNQKDMLTVYNTLDICVSTSIGEGFSNVIAEAMACEIPCVVTDVGDSANIVGDTGIVIPVGNPQKLASAISGILNMSSDQKQKLGKLARQRIVTEFSVEKMVSSTENELEKLG